MIKFLLALIVAANAQQFQKIEKLYLTTLSTFQTNGDVTVDLNGTGKLLFLDETAHAVPYLDANKRLRTCATAPTNGAALVYNASTGAWCPGGGTGGGGGGGTITEILAGIGLLGGGNTGSITLDVDAGTGPSQIVQLDGSSKLPAVDGSALTGINAANTTLSNLTSPTSVNQNLIFDTGSNVTISTKDVTSGSAKSLTIQGGSTSEEGGEVNIIAGAGSINGADVNITANGGFGGTDSDGGDVNITASTGEGTGQDGRVTIEGPRYIHLWATNGFSPGSIKFDNGTGSVIGDCWIATGTDGSGYWDTCPGGGSGISAIGSLGSSPNVDGAVISGSSLILEPADATHAGLITSGTQTIGGAKTFSGGVTTQLTASANVSLGNYYISGDGDNEGLQVGSTGGLTVTGGSLNGPLITAGTTQGFYFTGKSAVSGVNQTGSPLVFQTGGGTGNGTQDISFWISTLNGSGSNIQSSLRRAFTVAQFASSSLSYAKAQDSFRTPEVCDENGAHCFDVSTGWPTIGTTAEAWDADLDALASLASTGLIARTGTATYSERTLTAGSSKISIGNGDGVSGNPTVDVTESNLTISNMGGILALVHGGTGIAAASSQAVINNLTGTQTSGYYLRSNGTNSSLTIIQAADVPTLNQNTTGTALNVTGIVALANGGTGINAATSQALVNNLTGPQLNKSGYYMRSDGTNALLTVIQGGDLPAPTASVLGGVKAVSSLANKWVDGLTTAGVLTLSRPACADLSNAATSCSTDATNLANDTTGQLALANGGTSINAASTAALIVALLPKLQSGKVLSNDGSNVNWTAATTGTVTSVGVSSPSGLLTTGSTPVTTSGTITLTWAGTSGGIPYFSSTSTLASSGALTNHAIVLGGGAGATPTVVSSLGTSSQVLHGAAAGDPTWGALALGTEVSGQLALSNGGTGINAATSQALVNNLTGPQLGKSTYFLRSDGTNALLTVIQAADVPTLNQSTSGNAATATALASDPADCASNTYATGIATSGALTCGTVTNSGLAGSIAASKLIGSDIATVGTVTAGTWNAGIIGLSYGGTGINAATSLALVNNLTGPQSGKSGYYLRSDGTNAQLTIIQGGDLPAPTASVLGGIKAVSSLANKWIDGITTAGVATASRPACADLSNAATSCSTDATNLANDTTGQLALANGGTSINAASTGALLNALLPKQTSHSGHFLTSNGTDTSWAAASGSGVTAIGSLGASPNVDGAVISGSSLVLEPADATHAGLITSGTQTIGGAKTFSGGITSAVIGNADTATALAANPAACAADTYVTDTAAAGTLTCSTVTNAGLAGSIAASKLIGSDIATVGTITTGTWSGTIIGLTKGGTGFNASSSLALVDNLTGPQSGKSGYYLRSNGTDATLTIIQGADLPTPTTSVLGGIKAVSSLANKWIDGITALGVPTLSRPACADISDASGACTVDTRDMGNVTGGTLALARGGTGYSAASSLALVDNLTGPQSGKSGYYLRSDGTDAKLTIIQGGDLPTPTASVFGGVKAVSSLANKWVDGVTTAGVHTLSRPACADLSNAATSCSTDATNLANDTTGQLATANGGTSINAATTAALIVALLPKLQTTKVLTNDGSNVSWGTAGAGTVTSISVAASSPLGIVGGSPGTVTSSGTITINAANSTGSGNFVLATAPAVTGITTDTVSATASLISTQVLAQTSQDGLVLKNATAATSTVSQWSPRVLWEGFGWKTNATAASQKVQFTMDARPINNTVNPEGQLAINYAANAGALSTLVTFDGLYSQVLLEAGTVAAPSLSFRAASSMGIYKSGANQMSFSTAGVDAMDIDSSQNIYANGNLYVRKASDTGGITADTSYEYFNSPDGANRVTMGKSGTDNSIYIDLYDTAGSSKVHFRDSSDVDIATIDSDGNINRKTYYWSGYHNKFCSWTRANTAYGDPGSSPAACKLVELKNNNFGTVSVATPSSTLAALAITVPYTTDYNVCASIGNIGNSTAAVNVGAFLTNNAGNTLAELGFQQGSAGTWSPNLCGVYSGTLNATDTLKIQIKSGAGTATINGPVYTPAIQWQIWSMHE